jgi:ABC-type transport system involved in multi-copper enzyme maturation permease subunit
MWRAPASRRWLWDASAFVLFSALQPFCLNSGLISLLPSILAAACVYSAPGGAYPEAARRSFLVTCALSLVAVSNFGRSFPRLVLMLGINFWIMLALGATLLLAAIAPRDMGPQPELNPNEVDAHA